MWICYTFCLYFNWFYWRCYLFLGYFSLKAKLGYDDALDAFGLHGIGGTWGAIATGLFATTSVNSAGANGLFYGDASLLWKQMIAIIATYLFVAVVTYIIIKVVSIFFIPVRVSDEEESLGLDITLHGEKKRITNKICEKG
ncbi:hypothetical protein GCM10020331_093170 [Ectobacillus funiculus]